MRRSLLAMLGIGVIIAAILVLQAHLMPAGPAPSTGPDAGRRVTTTPAANAELDPDLVGYEATEGCVRLAEAVSLPPGDPPQRRCRLNRLRVSAEGNGAEEK